MELLDGLKEIIDIIKDDYFLLGKKEFYYRDYQNIKSIMEKPYCKRVLKRYKQCFMAIVYVIGEAASLFTVKLFLSICGMIFVIFSFITAPFLHILYWCWFKKVMKQKTHILNEAEE